MSRLPQPGGDDGDWGNILNDFLQQAHNTDGTLKSGSISSQQLAPGAVSSSALNIVGGSNGQVLTKDSSAASGFSWQSGSMSDATTSSKGAIQLTGDLGGTAAAPTVPALANKFDSANIDTDATLTADSDTRVASQKAVKAYIDNGLASKADASTVGATLLLIDNAAALPPGTPAGVVVVVKS